MKKQILLFSVVTVLCFLVTPSLPGGVGSVKSPKQKSVYCPVAGIPKQRIKDQCPGGYCSRRVRGDLSVNYKGGKIAFCCGGCVKSFKKAPSKFASAAHHQLVATGQASQVACPLCGNKKRSGTETGTLHVAGVKVLCCKECEKTLAAMKPAARLDAIFGEKAFQRGFTVKTEGSQR